MLRGYCGSLAGTKHQHIDTVGDITLSLAGTKHQHIGTVGDVTLSAHLDLVRPGEGGEGGELGVL